MFYLSVNKYLDQNSSLQECYSNSDCQCSSFKKKYPNIRIFCIYGGLAVPINPLTPNDHYSGRTAPLTSKRCILYIYSTNIGTEYFKHCIYSSFYFSSKCSSFHNSNVFGSCIIHILYTGSAKIKKKIRRQKVNVEHLCSWYFIKNGKLRVSASRNLLGLSYVITLCIKVAMLTYTV